MRNLMAIRRSALVLMMAIPGCGFRADPVKIDANVLPPRPLDGSATDVPVGPDGGTVDVPVSSAEGGAAEVAVSSGEAGGPATSRLFPESAPWYRDVTALPADLESPALIAGLVAAGGFGGGELLIDFGFEINIADATAPLVPLIAGPAFSRPDCDDMAVPLPAGGAVRDEAGYQCSKDGECHLIILQPATRRLFELWKASVTGGALTAGCLAVWDLSRAYGPSGRGTDCAGADTAGLPIAALLFTADEVAAGEIPHALRFSLPKDRIHPAVYLSPATHATPTTTGGVASLPLGARLRLRADFPLDGLTAGARVVARALQRHGMLLADGGTKALGARSDRRTTARWAGLLGERDLAAIKPTDFTVVDSGARVPYKGDCVRNP
jgi:serine/threonine-protein kinase